MKNYNKEDFLFKLKNANWETCFYATDVDKAWNGFNDIFMSILNSVVPIKEIKLKQRTEPWVDSELLKLIRIRDKHLKFTSSKNTTKERIIKCIVILEIRFRGTLRK